MKILPHVYLYDYYLHYSVRVRFLGVIYLFLPAGIHILLHKIYVSAFSRFYIQYVYHLYLHKVETYTF